jgi:hypothetical protein
MAHSCVFRLASDTNRFARNELPCVSHEGIGAVAILRGYCPNPRKINTLLKIAEQMQFSGNKQLKQTLKVFFWPRLKVFNGTND